MNEQRADAHRSRGEAIYRIGTVANLTGLSTHTIRAWERRYAGLVPIRSTGGTRLYSDQDVARLQMIRALGRCGEPIRKLASLSVDELRERLERQVSSEPTLDLRPGMASRVRVAVLHRALSEQMRANPDALLNLELVAAEDDLPGFLGRLAGRDVQILILDLALLGDDPPTALGACRRASGCDLALVTYAFAPRKRLAALAKHGAKLLQGPVAVDALRRVVIEQLAVQGIDRAPEACSPSLAPWLAQIPAPERRFDDKQLARLRELASSLDCECPNQLAALVMNLLAFERYCKECENASPEDARLHASLARGTGAARSIVEHMLSAVCEHDGIRV